MNFALSRFLYLNWATAVDGSGLGLPSCLTEAQLLKQSLSQLKEDIVLAKGALSLPLLEPLTKERLCQLTKISMGCLLAALSTATAQSIFSAVNPAPSKVLGSSSSNEHQLKDTRALTVNLTKVQQGLGYIYHLF